MNKQETAEALRLTRDQRDFLVDRIKRVETKFRYGGRQKLREPSEVKAARAAIKAWEAESAKADERASKDAEKRVRATRLILLFKSPREALAAVEALEREAGL